MSIDYELHRFGPDELAVGKLINGDLPADDQERWSIVDAPRYRIQKLLDEHLRAQETLRGCRDSGRPFALFLRSFSSEHRTERNRGNVFSQFALHSVEFQKWLDDGLAQGGIPTVKLHGGSDGLLSAVDGDGNVLSTHSENWHAVAGELVQAASVIVFLVSHVTPGVEKEFDLIRELGQTSRCLLVLLDPRDTPGGGSDDTASIRARHADFPHIFELHPNPTDRGDMTYPQELGQTLVRLVRGAKTRARLEQALKAQFSYLEPGFVNSESFATTEKYIWRQMRLLRVMLEDTYWAALKANGIPFEHFDFPGPWKFAHQLYGLAIATADFNAVCEALSHMRILYMARGADFALLLDPLARKYGELGRRIFPSGPPDTQARYVTSADPLKLPASIDTAINLFELAQRGEKSQDAEGANYMYQASMVCALRAKDGEPRWIVGNIARDWAKFQAESGTYGWALINLAFALKLFRDLAAADPGRYTGSVAMCLNNLGSLHIRREDLAAANVALAEALQIRRSLPAGSKNYLVDLYTSLANLGLLHVRMGDFARAHSIYIESLQVCQQRLNSEPATILDLTRQQAWLSLCLAKMPGRKKEGLEYARLAAGNLSKASQVSPQAATGLRPLVDEAMQANGVA